MKKMAILDLSTELQQVVSVLTPYANLQQVTLSVVVDTDHSILGDSQQLRQSLINLIKNGIEASSNGRVDVGVRLIGDSVLIGVGYGLRDDVRTDPTPRYALLFDERKGNGPRYDGRL